MSDDALQSIDPLAQADHDGDQTTELARQRAIELAHAGLPLSALEMALIFRETVSTFHKKLNRGVYDAFRLVPTLGDRHFSGARLTRYLNGEILEDVPASRNFGRKRKAS